MTKYLEMFAKKERRTKVLAITVNLLFVLMFVAALITTFLSTAFIAELMHL